MINNETTPLTAKNHEGDKKMPEQQFCRRWGVLGCLLCIVVCVIFAILKTNTSSLTSTSKETESKYKKVQGLGFQIYTGGAPAFIDEERRHVDKNGTVTTRMHKSLNPECIGTSRYGQMIGDEEEGKNAELQCYLGLEDASLDVTRRMKVMEEAVETAFAQADPDPSVLKVFLAPEFFWRGLDGAYEFAAEAPEDSSICGPVCQILHGLETLVAQPRFADWIFLFGTVTAWENMNSTKSATEAMKEGGEDILFYNFAPFYKGYDPTTTNGFGPRFIVPKRYVSSSDFLTPERHLHRSEVKELIDLSQQDEQRISFDQQPKKDGIRTAVLNPHDFAIKRYDNDMWKDYRQELDSLG